MEARILKIVTSNNVEIFRHLGAVESASARIEHTVGDTAERLWEEIIERKPLLAVIDTNLPDGSGYELCRKVKDHSELRHTHVILLQGRIMTKEDLARTAESRCDDVLSLPIHAEDFYGHIAQVTGVSLRRSHRVHVEMRASLSVDNNEYEGRVINVSATGMGMQVDEAIEQGAARIRLRSGDESPAEITGQVVWCHPNSSGFVVGLRFIGVPATAKSLLMRLAMFDSTINDDGSCTVRVQGGIDEKVDFEPLMKSLDGVKHINFMLQGVTYLSSSGVRLWCLFLESIPADVKYEFRSCSIAFASQAAMVPMVVGRGEVVSVQAPYFCEACDREETRLVESTLILQPDGSITPPPLHCHLCHEALTFDDIPSRYFAFLKG